MQPKNTFQYQVICIDTFTPSPDSQPCEKLIRQFKKRKRKKKEGYEQKYPFTHDLRIKQQSLLTSKWIYIKTSCLKYIYPTPASSVNERQNKSDAGEGRSSKHEHSMHLHGWNDKVRREWTQEEKGVGVSYYGTQIMRWDSLAARIQLTSNQNLWSVKTKS